jgi:hypothetical protein
MKTHMKSRTTIVLAAAVLLFGPAVASAQNIKPSDTLSLTATQQKAAWTDLHDRTTGQKEPSNFSAAIGAPLPGSVMITRVSSKAIKDVPSLKPYAYVVLNGQVLIVNPSDRKVAGVITSG